MNPIRHFIKRGGNEMSNGMKKNAFTLVELLITILISGALAFGIIYQFVALDKFNKMVTYTHHGGEARQYSFPVAAREARIVIHQMSNVLRFAKPSIPGFSFIDDDNENRINFTVEGGHIDAFPVDTPCYFRLDKTLDVASIRKNVFYFSYDGVSETAISSGNVVYFCTDNTDNAIWNPDTKMLTLKLTFSDTKITTSQGTFDTGGTDTIPIETAIKVLAN